MEQGRSIARRAGDHRIVFELTNGSFDSQSHEPNDGSI